MMRFKQISLIILTAALLGACTTTSQYTSGADYVARYDGTWQSSTGSEQSIRDIANIEPDLVFPARIGLARIENGRLISIPVDEAADWQELATRMGPSIGQFVPVSPLVTSMVSVKRAYGEAAVPVIDDIRRGSARQHLDYVLVYEVTDIDERKKNALNIADLTVLGLFVLPSRDIKVKATASAILIDVRNGYPYGTATAFAEKKGISTNNKKYDKTEALSNDARVVAVHKLTGEIETVIDDLKMMSANYASRW